MEYIKYMYMLITWMAVRVLRPVMDYFPFSLGPPATSRPYLLEGRFGIAPISSSFTSFPSSVPSIDMVLYEGYDAVPVQALGGALSQVSPIINIIRYFYELSDFSFFSFIVIIMVFKILLFHFSLPIFLAKQNFE